MPIQTDLSVSPYFDDFNENKDFYRVLFKPGVAVQVRELNQLQSILHKQIERFGDNIYKKGTIIDGCNFIFYNSLPYVKIDDAQLDSAPVNVSSFDSYLVKNSSNLVARIIKTTTGYQATAPDLNTLYVKYVSGGESGNAVAFTPGEILTVYDPALGLSSCTEIIAKSSGFSNTDTAVLLSAIIVQNSAGGRNFVNATGQACTFIVGDIITQEVTNARAEITQIDTVTIAGETVLSIRPLASELRMANTDSWTFKPGLQFTTSSSKITAKLKSMVGQGATASIITDAAGGIISYTILNSGVGYKVPPYATAYYSTPNTNPSANVLIDALNVRTKNYKAKVTVNSSLDAVGVGYGFGVSAGVIYQKGYFSRVNEQFVVVEKYSNVTSKTVGFDTAEEIIDYKKDFTLFDNATGTLNVNAPGANRLKLTPTLTVLSKTDAAANDQFFPIVEFSQGKAYKRNTPTVFNSIAKELAQRTYEQSGNYVTDGFLTATVSDPDFNTEPYNFQIKIDPGVGYINGYRTQYYDNYYQYLRKGINVEATDTNFNVNYGNYVTVNELGGIFKFSVGATVSLYDTASTYLTTSAQNGSFGNITPLGTEIGKARIRSLILINGVAGEPTARYNLYLFDIKMNIGQNFESVKSIYYNQAGNDDGIADVVLTGGKAVIFDPKNSSMVFKLGSSKALKTVENAAYTYRTIRSDITCNTQGYMSISISQNPGEYFPYPPTLSDLQKLSLIVIPSNTAICSNASGSVNVAAACTIVVGTSTLFDQTFDAGDYVRIANSTAAEIKRVAAVVNSSVMVIAGATANAYTSANIGLVFPKNVPIPLYLKNDREAKVESNTTLRISVGNTISSAVNVSVVFEVNKTTNQVAKRITRNAYVKINTSNNIANNTGPWCLGIPDIIRLNKVYLGNSTTVTTSSTDITENFWIDHNQRKEYYDVGYLYKNALYTLPSNTNILVCYDALSITQNGLKTIASYPINDTKKLSESIDSINTVEIPEMFLDNDQYYDLRDTFDFRPYTANTCGIITNFSNAPINPSEPEFDTRFDTVLDKKFPTPRSICSASIQTYKGRIDGIVMTANSEIKIIPGKSGDNPIVPEVPKDALLINYVTIPPYPSLPRGLSKEYSDFLNKKISNINYTNKRQLDYSIKTSISSNNVWTSQPQRYTMEDIANLERRIADLEYYTSLNMMEAAVNNINIPSSISSNATGVSLDRFKFGYFVDNFSTVDYSQLDDPTYSAQIYGYQLHPAKTQFNIKYNFNLNDANTVACVKGTKLILPSHRKQLISQNLATEATTMEVAITETVTSVTGTEIISTTTKNVEISSTSFTDNPRQILTNYANSTVTNSPENYNTVVGGTYAETVIQVKPYGYNNIPIGNYSNSTWIGAPFNASKLGGIITAGGKIAEDGSGSKAPYPKLQQYKNDTWIDVATASKGLLFDDRDGNGNVTLAGYDLTKTYVIQSGTTTDWALSHNFSADNINTLYRLVGGATPNGSLSSSITRGTYPQSRDVTIYNVKNPDGSITSTQSVPIYETQYTSDQNTVITTRIEKVPATTVVETPSTIKQNIFNPKLNGLITIDNIFTTSAELNDPFVDLAAYVQKQINS